MAHGVFYPDLYPQLADAEVRVLQLLSEHPMVPVRRRDVLFHLPPGVRVATKGCADYCTVGACGDSCPHLQVSLQRQPVHRFIWLPVLLRWNRHWLYRCFAPTTSAVSRHKPSIDLLCCDSRDCIC